MQLKSVLALFAFASLALASPAGELHERQESDVQGGNNEVVEEKCYCCQRAVQSFWFFKGAGTGCRVLTSGECGRQRPHELCCEDVATSGTGVSCCFPLLFSSSFLGYVRQEQVSPDVAQRPGDDSYNAAPAKEPTAPDDSPEDKEALVSSESKSTAVNTSESDTHPLQDTALRLEEILDGNSQVAVVLDCIDEMDDLMGDVLLETLVYYLEIGVFGDHKQLGPTVIFTAHSP
ncbi:hypothetical protein PENNAL_c0010G07226 [Penicillium nalgiovense]|uniref:Hydrophobin n=1 Tax=Penicillium nalgiovense TaxID=60175 RepID=A0A1V6YUX1_PENNA|nr:hypothetical protein PENNAL_c0010G07226 [Penicillium nalgiovense]